MKELFQTPNSELRTPMVEVVVTGIGLVSGLGPDVETGWQQLISGASAIRLHQPFPEIQPLPLALIDEQPASLSTLTHLGCCSCAKRCEASSAIIRVWSGNWF